MFTGFYNVALHVFNVYATSFASGADAGATNKRDRSARAVSLRALEKKKRLEAAKAQKAEQNKQGMWGALSGALFGAGTDVCVSVVGYM
jgi:hypothetical protein